MLRRTQWSLISTLRCQHQNKVFTEHAPLGYAVTASGGGATKEHAVTPQLTHCAAVGHHTHHIPEHSHILSADFDVRQAGKD